MDQEEKTHLPTFTNEILAIKPKPFYRNEETQNDNLFMHTSELSSEEIHEQAIAEFNNFTKTLKSNGIKVNVFEQRFPHAPDSIFPDWFTTHKNDDIPGGLFILYPMKY